MLRSRVAMSRDLSRRAVVGGALWGGMAAGLTACAARPPSETGVEISLYQNKREVVGHFRDLIARFTDETGGRISVVHDTVPFTLAAKFVRGAPPSLGMYGYNTEMARFEELRELSDLSDIAEDANIAPGVQALVRSDPSAPGRVSVLPYSMMGSGVLYHRGIFAEHDLEVPTTYREFIEVCTTLKRAGVTPIYATHGDPWTVTQGLFDYSIGGMLDLDDFFSRLRAQGADAGPDAPTSFSREFAEPLERALEIDAFTNSDALSRKYGDGNVAFARGKAAMYFQGPWALLEIDRVDVDTDIGVFPLPLTDSPDDRRVRVNVDLACWIPEGIDEPDAARELLRFLLRPEIADEYNELALGFGVRRDSPPTTDPRLTDIQGYVGRAAFTLPVSDYIPRTLSLDNHVQGLVTGHSIASLLRTIDEDWARLARRQRNA